MKYVVVILFIITYSSANARALSFVILNTAANSFIEKDSLTQTTLTTYLLKLNPRDITKVAGKKLILKEKVALLFIQHKVKRQQHHAAAENVKDNGKTAFILGLIGLVGLIIPGVNLASIPLAILAIVIGNKAKRENPFNKKARTGVTLGIITLGLLVIIGFTVAIVLTIGSFPR